METIQTNDPILADPTAVFGRRCFAYIIDFLILSVVSLIAVFAMATLEEVDSPAVAKQICDHYEDLDNDNVCLNLESAVFVFEATQLNNLVILIIAIAVLNSVIISSITGGSLGKLTLGIRVVNESTFEKAGILQHCLRWLLLIVDSFPWFSLVPLTGLILGLASKGHRRIGDFAAKTLVVDQQFVGRPTLVPGVNQGPATTMPLPEHWNPPIQPPPAESIAPELTTTQPSYATDLTPDTSDHVDLEQRVGRESEFTPESDVANQDDMSQPGVDAPMWDEARNTYIQWDPGLEAWMEWSASGGHWIPISQ